MNDAQADNRAKAEAYLAHHAPSEPQPWVVELAAELFEAKNEIDTLREIILTYGDRNVIGALEAHDADATG